MFKGFRLVRQLSKKSSGGYGTISSKTFKVFPIVQSPNDRIGCQTIYNSAQLSNKISDVSITLDDPKIDPKRNLTEIDLNIANPKRSPTTPANPPDTPNSEDKVTRKKITPPYEPKTIKTSDSGNQFKGTAPGPPPSGGSSDNGDKKTNRNALIALGVFVLAATIYKFVPSSSVSDVVAENNSKKKKAFNRPRPISKVPASSSTIPDEIQYLLIGGGTASFSAFRAIKSIDPTAKVLVIGDEPYFPYMRPPLSKEIWYSDHEPDSLLFKQWNGTERSLYYEPEDFYTKFEDLNKDSGGVSVARGWLVSKIEPSERKVILEDGKEIKYEKCLIATGAKPRTLPVLENTTEEVKNKITLFRNIFDYEELCELINNGAESIAIVGGGFLGSELACAVAKKGRDKNLKVYQIFRENGNMGKILPEYLSSWTSKKVEKEGVTVFNNSELENIVMEGKNKVKILLNSGKEVIADHVVVSVGVEPNIDLAKTSKLEVDEKLGGFLVNAELEARTDLYAAGDCACFYDVDLGRRRVEHHDHAVVSGRLAGENMTGAGKAYWHQSMFWSDIGPEVGFEAIGIIDSSLPTVGVYAKSSEEDKEKALEEKNESIAARLKELSNPIDEKPTEGIIGEKEDFGKGVIFYLRDGIVVGMVLWNIFNRMTVARQILKEQKKYEDLNEVAKLFNIHSN